LRIEIPSMKSLLVLLFLSWSVLTQAASYKSVFGSNAYDIIEYSYNGWPQIDTFWVGGDTLVHDTMCKKVRYTYLKNVIGVMREDTVGGKVWFRSFKPALIAPGDTDEVLLYDFNLKAGDSFDLAEYYGPAKPGDNIVDSVYYLNGNKHIRFRGSIINKNEHIEFIEGVGCNASNIYKYRGDFLYAEYLVCAYRNGGQVYGNKFYNGNCSPALSVDTAIDSNLILYPNPVADMLYVNLRRSYYKLSVSLIDINGQQVMTKTFSAVSEIAIDMTTVNHGLYFLNIREDNHDQHFKIIKL